MVEGTSARAGEVARSPNVHRPRASDTRNIRFNIIFFVGAQLNDMMATSRLVPSPSRAPVLQPHEDVCARLSSKIRTRTTLLARKDRAIAQGWNNRGYEPASHRRSGGVAPRRHSSVREIVPVCLWRGRLRVPSTQSEPHTDDGPPRAEHSCIDGNLCCRFSESDSPRSARLLLARVPFVSETSCVDFMDCARLTRHESGVN